MLLRLVDLATRKWEGEPPFPNTLAEAMFADVAYALIHAAAQDVDACTLADGAAQAGCQLDFAAYSKVMQQIGATGLRIMIAVSEN